MFSAWLTASDEGNCERPPKLIAAEFKREAIKLVTEQGLTLAVLIYSAACAALRGFA